MFEATSISRMKSHGTVALTDDLRLQKGRIHEVMGPARASFAGIVAGATLGSIIWIGRDKTIRSIHPDTLSQFFAPGRMLSINCLSRKEILWAGEQALQAQEAGCVVLELALGPNLTESRRLQLAAEEGGGIGLVLIDTRAQTSSAQTRWQCRSLPTEKIENLPEWEWRLTKDKAGRAARWQVNWKGVGHAPDYVRLVSEAAA